MSTWQAKRETLGRQLEGGYIDRLTFIREREALNRAERAEIRRLAAALKDKQAERAP